MILDDATSSSASSGAIGYFDIEEIIPGKDRAADSHGAFHVRDVKGFMLAAKEEEEEDFDMTRTLMAAQAASKQQVYAMKTIHHSSFSDCPHREFKKAVAHLSNEAAMMSVLRHKNILELRGVASSGTEAYCETGRHDAYFIITGEQNCSFWHSTIFYFLSELVLADHVLQSFRGIDRISLIQIEFLAKEPTKIPAETTIQIVKCQGATSNCIQPSRRLGVSAFIWHHSSQTKSKLRWIQFHEPSSYNSMDSGMPFASVKT